MKIASFSPRYDNTMQANPPADQERLTFAMFKAIHGGAAATADEAKQCTYVPDGFSVWRTARGELLAIRDE
ncbi:hypothetical protein LBW59_25045 [Ralstonia solanacearum]|uniref:Uncharacterized protein n=1 Tax=Ralstonia solanacearum TaxID=305 RepID=A0AAW5ZWI5_RALSL|nr:hypothetical protein [Ralstonia solanacearum]MDB0574002.1 hypothetical protein [Ralstonia solanacearum]CBJ42770.1 conserved protein of unknown function [Ralstonia solanacearum CFBP2957]